MRPDEIKPRCRYYGKKAALRRSSAWREVVSIRNGIVIYVIGRSYGSDERECSLATFARWAVTEEKIDPRTP